MDTEMPGAIESKQSKMRGQEKMKQKPRTGAIFYSGTFLAAFLLAPCKSFVTKQRSSGGSIMEQAVTNTESIQKQAVTRIAAVLTDTEPSSASAGSIQTYEHDGWTLTYRYKPASRGYESQDPLILIHPVGIGLSSWFWIKFFECWQGAELFAPDLIGCGIKNGGDAFNPDVRGISFPLGWAQGCEALMNKHLPVSSVLNLLPIPSAVGSFKSRSWNVVCQGGLAPVGVMLASRNPNTVSRLILTSPPTWKDMTTIIPEEELNRNYSFLRNSLVEPIAFGLLETHWAIEYFSNLFLFSNQCDQQWLDLTFNEIVAPESRPPVAAFNAGLCNHRSFREELETLKQPTLVLSGDGDGRTIERKEYASNMQDCTLLSLPGKNVLPWESAEEVCNAVKDFCY